MEKQSLLNFKKRQKQLKTFGWIAFVLSFLSSLLLAIWDYIDYMVISVILMVLALVFFILSAVLSNRIDTMEYKEREAEREEMIRIKEAERQAREEERMREEEKEKKERLQKERMKEQLRQSAFESLSFIWPYGQKRVLAILSEDVGKTERRGVSVGIQYDETNDRVLLLYGANCYPAVVKETGIYHVSNDLSLILNKNSFKKNAEQYLIPTEGREVEAYNNLFNSTPIRMVSMDNDLSDRNLVDLLPRYEFCFDNNTIKSSEDVFYDELNEFGRSQFRLSFSIDERALVIDKLSKRMQSYCISDIIIKRIDNGVEWIFHYGEISWLLKELEGIGYMHRCEDYADYLNHLTYNARIYQDGTVRLKCGDRKEFISLNKGWSEHLV